MIDSKGFLPADSFSCDRETTCCVTGHRKRDLPGGGDTSSPPMRRLISILGLLVEEAYRDGYRTFLSGMAEGIDLIFAQLVCDLGAKTGDKDIKLVCVLPYAEQVRELTDPSDLYTYSAMVKYHQTVVVSGRYDKERYKKRNTYMVKHSSRVIGVYKKKPHGSGTLQTINIARREGLFTRIVALDDDPLFSGEVDRPGESVDLSRVVLL